jgi:hypothetical protein
MDAKLTLKLDQEVIAKAKEYAAEKQMSLSRLIEHYLKAITTKDKKQMGNEIEISPFVKSFMNSEVKLPHDLDYKKEYGDYLEKKYQ